MVLVEQIELSKSPSSSVLESLRFLVLALILHKLYTYQERAWILNEHAGRYSSVHHSNTSNFGHLLLNHPSPAILSLCSSLSPHTRFHFAEATYHFGR
jgi:hypothetical protein